MAGRAEIQGSRGLTVNPEKQGCQESTVPSTGFSHQMSKLDTDATHRECQLLSLTVERGRRTPLERFYSKLSPPLLL